MSARAGWGRTVAWALLFLGGVLMVTPFVYMLSTSLKPNAEVYELSLLPRTPTHRTPQRLPRGDGWRWPRSAACGSRRRGSATPRQSYRHRTT